jgi:hypothetical protein
MEKQIPQEIKDGLDQVAKQYSESTATTNAGRVLRFICRFIKPSTIAKMVAHKFG